MAGRYRRDFCTTCGQPKEIVGQISRRGLCGDCAESNMRNCVIEIVDRNGKNYELWLDRMAEYVERERDRISAGEPFKGNAV